MAELVELVPGKLFRLGGRVPTDGRVTWLPPQADGYEPMNCYLLAEPDAGMLVDSGVGIHEDAIVEQIRSVVAEGTPLSVFLTRMEPDVVSGLGAILRSFRVKTVSAGGTNNPFDYFEDLNSSTMVQANYRAELHRWLPGQVLTISGDRALDVVVPALRLLFTSWLYDATTRTLFTSDALSHSWARDADADPVLTEDTDAVTYEDFRSHLLTKFEYLKGARTEPIIARFREIFEQYDIERVAPTHGCVLGDAATVRRHLGMLIDVLEEVDESRRESPVGQPTAVESR